MKKKREIKYDPSLLDDFSEEERGKLKQLLDNLDPKELIENSYVVDPLPPNTIDCPHCNSSLRAVGHGWKDKSGESKQIFHCDSCDKEFWGNKLN